MLWNQAVEVDFFNTALENFASPQQLFYQINNEYYAYIPRNNRIHGQTLQSRNALIGDYTERWCQKLFSPIAEKFGLFAITKVRCDDFNLTSRSPADLAFCRKNSSIQTANDIVVVFEVKMSIVSNYRYSEREGIQLVGDYNSHTGQPSLLRSDSMLKAIGKSLIIRVADWRASNIPIVILGNTPISNSYLHKVDLLKKTGAIQGIWSLYPNPITGHHNYHSTENGFLTIQNEDDLVGKMSDIISNPLQYFSAMLPKPTIGEYIRIANQKTTDVEKAEKFLELLRGTYE